MKGFTETLESPSVTGFSPGEIWVRFTCFSVRKSHSKLTSISVLGFS